MTEEKEAPKKAYELVDVEVQCLNCYSVWRIEHEVEEGERPALRADLLQCPLCFDDFDESL